MPPDSGRTLVRQGSVLSLLTLGSRVLGLLREMTKASLLGTSALSDAFSVAFMIPNLFRRLFAEGSVAVAFIPTFKEYLLAEAGDRAGAAGEKAGLNESRAGKETAEFLSCAFTLLSFFVSMAVAAGILLSPLIIPLFGKEEFNETVFLTRLMFPFLGFISLAALFQGILNSLHVFTPPGLAPIVLNLVTILCAYGLFPFTKNPARAMAIGILAGGFLEAAVQFPFVLKKRRRFFFVSLGRALNNPGAQKVLRLIGPTVIGMAAYQINDLVSTALARNAGTGIVSSLQYSLRLQELILGVFAVSIGTVLLPDLAEYAKSLRWDIYNRRLIAAMDIIALVTVPITFFTLAQGETLIRLLFQNRSFNDESVRLTLSALRCHMPGLFFIALNRILAPAFYAQSDSKSPTLAGLISFGVNIGLAFLLVRPLRGAGIALALTLSSAVNTALLLAFLRRNPHVAVARALRSALAYTARLAVFSVLAAAPLLPLGPRLTAFFAGRGRLVSYGIPFALSACIFAAIGILLLFISRDKQATALVKMLRRRGKE
ncbi:MAG: murein biosynthesis integral membrane protein MurJ [Treponema sp.]|jgi:putative peptidoglycan lipid II flippase|nr:murein biosynthesis integral membrane protein MurJ [Treponema sp.]